MRFRLRTLLVMLALSPPVLAGAWWAYQTQRPNLQVIYEHEQLRLKEARKLWSILRDNRGSPFDGK